LHQQTTELGGNKIDYRPACSVPRADPVMNIGAAHDFALVPWNLLLSRLNGTIGGRQGPKVEV
jgi:hypothetical protein